MKFKIEKTLYFLDSVNDFDILEITKKGSDKYKIFSFNIQTHKLLESKKVDHYNAENYIIESDRVKIFDHVLFLWDWYTKNPIFKVMEFEGINILGIYDTAEFHNLIVNELFNFWLVKRVLEEEKPDKIVTSEHFATMIRSITSDIEIDLRASNKTSHQYIVSWDKFLIRFNIGKIPISIPISRSAYTKMKNFFESFVSKSFGLNFDLNNKNKTLLFLEFNPLQYAETVKHLRKLKKNIVFFNMRRSAIWNYKAIKLFYRYGCKIITQNILNDDEKNRIAQLHSKYLNELNSILLQDKIFEEIFSIDGYSFWFSIKKPLKELYKKRMMSYVQLLILAKKIVENCNVSCILSLNNIGETEKAVFGMNKNNIPSIMLQHAFTNYIKELTRYDVFDTSVFKDKIALWGNLQKKHLVENRNVSGDKIILVGSPRHDVFFKIKNPIKETQKTIVITTQNMETTNVLVDTNTYLNLENLFRKIFSILKKFPEIRIIVKLHPAQDPGNEYLKKMIYELDSNIIIHQTTPIMDILKSCYAIININSELFPSTTLLEGMILKKPILNIVTTNSFYEFDFIKHDAMLTISHNESLEAPINEIICNESLRQSLSDNAWKYATNYLSNPGNASEYLATILNKF